MKCNATIRTLKRQDFLGTRLTACQFSIERPSQSFTQSSSTRRGTGLSLEPNNKPLHATNTCCFAAVTAFQVGLTLPGWLWELIACDVKSFGEGIGAGAVSTQVPAARKSSNVSPIHRNWKRGLNHGHLIKSRAQGHAEL